MLQFIIDTWISLNGERIFVLPPYLWHLNRLQYYNVNQRKEKKYRVTILLERNFFMHQSQKTCGFHRDFYYNLVNRNYLCCNGKTQEEEKTKIEIVKQMTKT